MNQYKRQQQLNNKILNTIQELLEEVQEVEEQCEDGGCSHLFNATMWIKAYEGVGQDIPSIIELACAMQQSYQNGDRGLVYIDENLNNALEELQ